MAKTAINLYSVRELDEPMLEILDRVADAGYDGVQISGGLRDASAEEIREKLDETGLEPTPAHVGIDQFEDDLEETLATYRETIGCDGGVVPYLDGEQFESEEAVKATAARLERIANDLAGHEFGLHYHNHDHEFVDVDGRTAFDLLIEETEHVEFELDVGWVATGGQDPVALIDRLGDRIDVVHMKDMDVENREFREIGEGDVDMQACADAARDVDATWLVYEHDDPENPAESIETGARVLNSL